MEALSVGSSIIGLIAAGAQLVPMFYNLASAVKDAPQHLHGAVSELKSITMVLTQLQKYIDGTTQASIQRLSLIPMDHVLATLTECVMTYSELDSQLKALHVDQGLHAWDRAIWLLKREDIERLVNRLQNHKSTLGLMLQIIQCTTQAEAERNMEHLCSAVNEVLVSNHALASRLRSMEHIMSSSMSIRTTRTFETPPSYFPVMDEELSTPVDTCNTDQVESPSIRSNDEANTPTNWPFITHSFQPELRAFEEQLHQTRVYRHAADRQSLYSSPGDGLTTLAISLSSTLTLGEVSKISVYALPISVTELSNAQCYGVLSPPSASTAQTPASGTLHVQEPYTGYQVKRFRRSLPNWSTKGNEQILVRPVGGVFGAPIDEVVDERKSVETIITHAVFVGNNLCDRMHSLRVPIVVALIGIALKQKMTRGTSIFTTPLSTKSWNRIQKLQEKFDDAPTYGKDVDLSTYTVNECTALLLRYLLRLPEPLISAELCERFREPGHPVEDHSWEADRKKRKGYSQLISELPSARKQLLLFTLDLLAFLASRESISTDWFPSKARAMAEIFYQTILRSPTYSLPPTDEDNARDRAVVTFLIENAHFWLRYPNGYRPNSTLTE